MLLKIKCHHKLIHLSGFTLMDLEKEIN